MDASAYLIEGSQARWISRRLFGIWNLLIVLVTTYASFATPYHIYVSELEGSIFLREVLISLFFGADTIISQQRLKRSKGVQFYENRILKSYYRRWLVLDIIAAVPFILLFPGADMLPMLHLLKLVKVVYLFVILVRIYIPHANTLLLLQILYGTALLAHWLSCVWLLIRGVDGDPYSAYISALYWVVATLTTVGYGDITAETDLERLYAIFTMVLGYSLIGYMIGSIAGILTKKNPARERYLHNLDQLSNAVRYAQLPLDLQQRIHAYFTYRMECGIGYDEASFIAELPRGLRAEVSLYFRQEVIERVPLFIEAPDSFILEVAQHLEERIVPAGDYVFKQGDMANEMYFIARGELEVKVAGTEEATRPRVLREGDFFGEIALFHEIPRTATVKATTYCDLYSLNKMTFNTIFTKYPEVARQIQEKAEMRVKNTA